MSAIMSALALIDEIVVTRELLERQPRRLAEFRALQHWQSERLHSTYADFAADARYASALEFFVQDLYGPHDFRRRHGDLRKVLHQWQRLLPERALQAVMYALQLEALTQTLDLAVVAALDGVDLTAATYAAAYRRADRRIDRQRQIWLILAAGRTLDSFTNAAVVGIALQAAKLPARLLGVSTLQDFLERGYAAFKQMGGATQLLRAIEQRETAILQRLFAGSNDPFRIDASVAVAHRSQTTP
jgi:hypothetical protein